VVPDMSGGVGDGDGRDEAATADLTLHRMLAMCRDHVATVLAQCGHIWQRDPFSLHVAERHHSMGRHLYGRVAFGDNIEVGPRGCGLC
jgi:hypothetical protein